MLTKEQYDNLSAGAKLIVLAHKEHMKKQKELARLIEEYKNVDKLLENRRTLIRSLEEENEG